MVSVRTDNLSLAYRVYEQITLAAADKRLLTGGRLERRDKGGSVVALDRVSFALEAGDRLGLVGPNGAGKTTLLKVLYGIYEPTGGSLAITGRRDALFNITLGFRAEATGRRNIELRGLINGWTPEQIESRMDSIIAFSELGEFIELPLKTYSQGMAARLAFSVATTLDPEILLMDEWIGAGDPGFQDKAQRRMKEMASRAGIIVLASHNHGLLKHTCNKILVLERGRVKDLLPVQEWAAAA